MSNQQSNAQQSIGVDLGSANETLSNLTYISYGEDNDNGIEDPSTVDGFFMKVKKNTKKRERQQPVQPKSPEY